MLTPLHLHLKLVEIARQSESDEYVSVAYIAGLFCVSSEMVLERLTVLHDLRFLEYSKRSKEMVRLTFTGKLANLEDYCRISDYPGKTPKEPCKELQKEETDSYRALPFIAFSK